MLDSRRQLFIAVTFMLGATMLLASMHGLVRLLSGDLHPFVVVFFRNLCGVIAISPIFYRKGLSVFATEQTRLHTFRAFIGICAMMAFFYGLSKVPLANATALSFSTTLFAALFAAYFLKERLRIRRIAAIVTGFIGVVVVLNPNVEEFNAYSLVLLLAALAWGASVTVVKQLTKTESSWTIVSIMSVSLTVLSIIPAWLFWRTPTLIEFGLLMLVGALATGGHLLMTEAIKKSEVAIVMSMDFARLLWTSIIGVWLFGDPLDLNTYIGAVMIFGSGWYIIFRESKLKQQSAN